MKNLAHIAGWRKLFSDETNGLRTSNESFLRALLTYGSFENLHLFLPEPLIPSFKEHWASFLEKSGRASSTHIHTLWSFPFELESKPLDIIVLGDPRIEKVSYLRKALCQKPIALCGLTHSLHNFGDPVQTLEFLCSYIQPCDSLICTSLAGKETIKKALEYNAERLNQRLKTNLSYDGRLDHIPLGVEPTPALDISIEEARQTLDLPIKKPLVLCNGRLSIFSKMDHMPLLLALKEIISTPGLEETQLLLAGAVELDSAYLNTLIFRATQLGIEKHLLFKLNYESWMKPYLYHAADVVVSIPDNIQETFGVAPVEAMLAGRPVIVSSWDGHRELITDGLHGFTIPTYWSKPDPMVDFVFSYSYEQGMFYMAQSVAVDIPILVNRLQKLLKDKELRLKMGKAAQTHAKATFTWEKIIPRYEALWQSLAQSAQQIPWSGPSYKTEAPSVYDLFSHFASHTLKPTDQIIRTPYGTRIDQKEETINLYPTVLTWLSSNTLFKILSLTQNPISIESLLKQIPEKAPLITYLILWSAKNGLLQILPT